MPELTELEKLQKNVVDTYATFHHAFNGWQALGDPFFESAQAAWCEAKLDLAEYLKEQQDNG